MFQAVRMQQLVDLQAGVRRLHGGGENDAVVNCNADQHAGGPAVPVPEHEKTWMNVVKIPPGFVTTAVVAFKLVDINQNYPLRRHGGAWIRLRPLPRERHILDHEDNAMKLLP
ncbi:hypothetical protein ACP4OV_022384 [Aristida adscensionis]